MPTANPTEHLQRARATIRRAMAEWDATNLARVEDSREMLVTAATDMRVFEAAVRSGAVLPTEELRSSLMAACRDIAQTTRVVDACVAFHRGLAASSGASPLGYNAEGQVAGETTGMEPEVLA
jgi:hypothetical protein